MAEHDAIELAELSRDRICWAHPFLAPALERLKPASSTDKRIEHFATDGEKLWLNAEWTKSVFARSPQMLDVALLHALCHCLLGHPHLKDATQVRLSTACDVQAMLLCTSLAPEIMDKKSWPLRELLRRFGNVQSPAQLVQLMVMTASCAITVVPSSPMPASTAMCSGKTSRSFSRVPAAVTVGGILPSGFASAQVRAVATARRAAR